MKINTIGSNIPANLNDDPLLSAEAGMSLPAVETEKTPPEQGSPIQDSLSISKDARAEKEKALLEELKRIDREVQQHESAHQAAAGELFRGKSFTYKIGPDGQRYAVAGDVQVDTSAVPGNPKATIAKMQKIRRAALSPGDPSAQDMNVAEAAMKTEMEAEQELQKQSLASLIKKPSNIKLPFPQKGISAAEDNSTSNVNTPSSAIDDSNLEDNSSGSRNSISLKISTSISSLYGSQQLNSPNSKHIDISI